MRWDVFVFFILISLLTWSHPPAPAAAHTHQHTHFVARSGCSHPCVTLEEQQVVAQMETGITHHTRIWNLLVSRCEAAARSATLTRLHLQISESKPLAKKKHLFCHSVVYIRKSWGVLYAWQKRQRATPAASGSRLEHFKGKEWLLVHSPKVFWIFSSDMV